METKAGNLTFEKIKANVPGTYSVDHGGDERGTLTLNADGTASEIKPRIGNDKGTWRIQGGVLVVQCGRAVYLFTEIKGDGVFFGSFGSSTYNLVKR